jgi:hypothetical protein
MSEKRVQKRSGGGSDGSEVINQCAGFPAQGVGATRGSGGRISPSAGRNGSRKVLNVPGKQSTGNSVEDVEDVEDKD